MLNTWQSLPSNEKCTSNYIHHKKIYSSPSLFFKVPVNVPDYFETRTSNQVSEKLLECGDIP